MMTLAYDLVEKTLYLNQQLETFNDVNNYFVMVLFKIISLDVFSFKEAQGKEIKQTNIFSLLALIGNQYKT